MYKHDLIAVHALSLPLLRLLLPRLLYATLQEPNPYEESVLGFVEPKLGTLTSLIGITYLINVAISLLVGTYVPSSRRVTPHS